MRCKEVMNGTKKVLIVYMTNEEIEDTDIQLQLQGMKKKNNYHHVTKFVSGKDDVVKVFTRILTDRYKALY